jgi:hypothetical protein
MGTLAKPQVTLDLSESRSHTPCLFISIRGDRSLASRFVILIRSLLGGRLHPLCALTLALIAGAGAPLTHDASAKAPPLATSVLDVDALAAPGYDADPVAVIPRGVEVELTGEAAPGFLGVYYDGQAVWVPSQYLSLGDRPGIDTGVTVADTPLLDAPMRDASVQEIIREGQAVILTGASVDGYDAAAHDGTGGWIDERDLSR